MPPVGLSDIASESVASQNAEAPRTPVRVYVMHSIPDFRVNKGDYVPDGALFSGFGSQRATSSKYTSPFTNRDVEVTECTIQDAVAVSGTPLNAGRHIPYRPYHFTASFPSPTFTTTSGAHFLIPYEITSDRSMNPTHTAPSSSSGKPIVFVPKSNMSSIQGLVPAPPSSHGSHQDASPRCAILTELALKSLIVA